MQATEVHPEIFNELLSALRMAQPSTFQRSQSVVPWPHTAFLLRFNHHSSFHLLGFL